MFKIRFYHILCRLFNIKFIHSNFDILLGNIQLKLGYKNLKIPKIH